MKPNPYLDDAIDVLDARIDTLREMIERHSAESARFAGLATRESRDLEMAVQARDALVAESKRLCAASCQILSREKT